MSVHPLRDANVVLARKMHEAQDRSQTLSRDLAAARDEVALWKGAAAGLAKQRDALLHRMHAIDHPAARPAGETCLMCVEELRRIGL